MKHYAKHLFAVLATIMLMAPAASKGQVWTADPVHSTVMYTIKHMVTPMIGMFKKYNVDITWNAAKPLEGDITATLDASSVVMGMDSSKATCAQLTFLTSIRILNGASSPPASQPTKKVNPKPNSSPMASSPSRV